MAQARKFLFDTAFESARPQREQKPKPQFTEADLAAARGEGQQAGFAMGREQAMRETARRVADALEAVAEALARIDAAQARVVGEIRPRSSPVGRSTRSRRWSRIAWRSCRPSPASPSASPRRWSSRWPSGSTGSSAAPASRERWFFSGSRNSRWATRASNGRTAAPNGACSARSTR
jgi:hypothetical protein